MTELLDRDEEALLERLSQSQPASARELSELLGRVTTRVVDIVLGHERMRQRVGDRRHRVLTTDYTAGEDKTADDPRMYRLCEVGVYDYDEDAFIIARVDLRDGRVTDVFVREGVHPPITAEELRDAREIAAASAQIRKIVADEGAQVVAFPAPTYTFEHRHEASRHRACLLFAGDAAGASASAAVDLSARELIPDDQLPALLRSQRPNLGHGEV